MSVDGTHFRIKEPRKEPSKSYYSYKFNKPGAAYEIGLDLHESRCVWLNGPFHASVNDLGMFRAEGGLKEILPPNAKVIADKGYIGEDAMSTPNEFDSEEVKNFKRRARARHEDFNSRLKEYAVLSERFRYTKDPYEQHKILFQTICVIVQYTLENGRPLFEN